MKKLNQVKIDEIRKLTREGKSQKEIAKIMGVCQQTISYWIIDESKRKERIKKAYSYFRKKSLEERQKIYRKRREYMKKYQYSRYHNDPEFRKRRLYYSKMRTGIKSLNPVHQND
jgi:IS30 family transposase